MWTLQRTESRGTHTLSRLQVEVFSEAICVAVTNALSLFATWYRGYAVIGWASADAPQDLEEAADALRVLSFGEDKRTAECFDSTN